MQLGDDPALIRINALIRGWTHLPYADIHALVDGVVDRFAIQFQQYPLCVKLIGSLARGAGTENSDIDLLIETSLPGLSKFEGAGFLIFKQINGGRCPAHLDDLHSTVIGCSTTDLAKAGLIDLYYRTPRRTRPPYLTMWLPPAADGGNVRRL